MLSMSGRNDKCSPAFGSNFHVSKVSFLLLFLTTNYVSLRVRRLNALNLPDSVFPVEIDILVDQITPYNGFHLTSHDDMVTQQAELRVLILEPPPSDDM